MTFWSDHRKLGSAYWQVIPDDVCPRSHTESERVIVWNAEEGCTKSKFSGDHVAHLCAALTTIKLSSGIGLYSIVLEETGIDQGAYSSHPLQDGDYTGARKAGWKGADNAENITEEKKRLDMRKGLEMKPSTQWRRFLVLGLLAGNLKHTSNWCKRHLQSVPIINFRLFRGAFVCSVVVVHQSRR